MIKKRKSVAWVEPKKILPSYLFLSNTYVKSELCVDDVVAVLVPETGDHLLGGGLGTVQELGQAEGIPESLAGGSFGPRDHSRARLRYSFVEQACNTQIQINSSKTNSSYICVQKKSTR